MSSRSQCASSSASTAVSTPVNTAQRRRFRAIVAILIVGAALTAVAILQIVMAQRISPGVTVAGVDLGGLSAEAAAETLGSDLWPRISLVQLKTGEKKPLTLSLEQLGISLDATATAAAAAERGRHELPFGLRACGCPGVGETWSPFSGSMRRARAGSGGRARAARCIAAGRTADDRGEGCRGRSQQRRACRRCDRAYPRDHGQRDGRVRVRRVLFPCAVSPDVDTSVAESRAGAAAPISRGPSSCVMPGVDPSHGEHQWPACSSVNLGANADALPLRSATTAPVPSCGPPSWAERPPLERRASSSTPRAASPSRRAEDGESSTWSSSRISTPPRVSGGRRTVVVATTSAGAQALQRRCAQHGPVFARVSVHDLLRPEEQGACRQHRARRQARRRHRDRSGAHVLAERRDGPAHGE